MLVQSDIVNISIKTTTYVETFILSLKNNKVPFKNFLTNLLALFSHFIQ